MAQQLF